MFKKGASDNYWNHLANIKVDRDGVKRLFSFRIVIEDSTVEINELNIPISSVSSGPPTPGPAAIPFGRWLRLARWSARAILDLPTPDNLSDVDMGEFDLSSRIAKAKSLWKSNLEKRGVNTELDDLAWALDSFLVLADKYDRVVDQLERMIIASDVSDP